MAGSCELNTEPSGFMKSRKSLTSWTTVSFSRRTLLNGAIQCIPFKTQTKQQLRTTAQKCNQKPFIPCNGLSQFETMSLWLLGCFCCLQSRRSCADVIRLYLRAEPVFILEHYVASKSIFCCS